ncbi:major facilitator superfamily domain-containing protein [Cercophora newfieldiana]|uniref:Major facilitator superfamily domain-containing protein n=1 Tax=Cercophora newfieldiana TaxID=92897 RepID=A0AA39Y424_9PEZI|nr:major facilitator superfamily domain-containing protein [Cercophora newfieldiana]
MRLTMPSRHRNPDEFPTVQLFLLAIVRLAEPIALTSIFPYAWPLIKRFKIGSEDDASFYAGLLISSFSLAEALMGMYWGSLSDRIGRKPVLLVGCVGTMFSMLMVGLAPNIWVALLGRAIGGLLNGNIAVIQTMVGELVTKREHEPKAYSIMPFVWSIGTIIGPAIGGTFADPHETFPDTFPKGSLFEKFPYLLPNLICAGMLLMSILLGYFLLEETHPDMQPRVLLPDTTFLSENTPLIETSDAMKRPAVDLRDENYGTIRSIDGVDTSGASTKNVEKRPDLNVFTNKRIMAVVLALSIFTYHSMTYDHLLPIFLEDDRAPLSHAVGLFDHFSPFYSPGGLGFSLQAVGMIMAIQGLIALFMQAVVFPIMAERMGVHRLFIFVTLFHPIAYAIMPSLLFVPEQLLYPALYLFLTIRNFFGILVYPLLLILIKEATPSLTILGKVNGLAASASAACRMVAPPVAGYLYAMGRRMDCTALAWYGSTFVAILGAIQCFSVTRSKARERSANSLKAGGIPASEMSDSDAV